MTKPDKINLPPQTQSVTESILVIDDSMGQRLLLSRILSRSNAKVRSAASGEEALEMCQAEVPDLIVCDWMMPGMNGLEFCKRFRDQWSDRYSYFILLTSNDEKQNVALGLDAGADDFLTKPVNASELKARVRAGQRVVGMERELTEKNRLIGATLDRMTELHKQLDADLLEARRLQQSLVPDRETQIADFDISLSLEPAGRVGGDLVGTFKAGDGEFGVFAIDVSGHGIASALITVRLASLLSGVGSSQNIAMEVGSDGVAKLRSPAEVAARLNTIVLEEIETEHYLTLVLATVETRTGRVTFVQAGHPHPAVQRATGEVEFVGDGGLPIGLIPGAEFSECQITLEPGDRLFIASDGITECADSDDQLLEEEGLQLLMQDLKALKGQALFEAIRDRLSGYSGREAFDDDISAVLLERRQK